MIALLAVWWYVDVFAVNVATMLTKPSRDLFHELI